mgnify:CR=1 FL=1
MLTMVGIAVGSGAGATAAPEPNTVVNSAPTDGATVQTSPDIIVIGFAEELGSVNSITVDCDGASIPLGDLEHDPVGWNRCRVTGCDEPRFEVSILDRADRHVHRHRDRSTDRHEVSSCSDCLLDHAAGEIS